MAKETVCKTNNKNKIGKPTVNKKKHETSDSSDNSDSDSNESSEEEEDFKAHKFRKLLSETFPSKYIDKKIAAEEKLKKAIRSKINAKKNKHSEGSDDDLSEEEVQNVVISKNKKITKTKIQNKGKDKGKSKGKGKDLEDSDEEEDDDNDESDYEDVKDDKKKSNKFNIVFTIGNKNDEEWETEDDDSDYDDEEEEEDEDEDEDVDVSDDDEDDDDEEDDDEDDGSYETEEEEEELPVKSSKTKDKAKTNAKDKDKDKDKDKTSNDDTLKENEDLLTSLKSLQDLHKNSKIVETCVKTCEDNIKETKKKQEKRLKKQQDKNSRIFKKQLREKNTTNDLAFFNKMDLERQKLIIKEFREINKITQVEKPYRLTLLESTMPNVFKAEAMKRVNALKHMEPGSGEFYKIKNWVDTFMKIPFGTYEKLPISITNGVDSCHNFMAEALTKLDDAVYGLNDAKMQVMQMLGQLISNPNAIGGSVALKGPPGTGKTSLIKDGISKILNRPFAFIALGGATDSSFLEGHSYTYEGSTWGKIVQIIIDSKCMNPVIYFDELDKISDTPKGEEIAGILTHLTDSTQNSQFHDKYFSEVDFDLSKCLFIFSYNDESKVSPILRDRMYKIQTKGYEKKQKIIIANQYLLPKIREQVKFEEGSIKITEEAMHHIIDNHCSKEEGVRNLKRCLEIIYTKLNLYRLMKPETNLFEQEITLKVEFPFTVTKLIVDKLIKPNSDPEMWRNLYN
jgi:ATP-dependent Lon protease